MKQLMRIVSFYMKRTGRYGKWMPLSLVLISLSAVAQAFIARAAGQILDAVTVDAHAFIEKWFWPTLGIITAVALLYALIEYIQKLFNTLVASRVKEQFQKDLYIHLLTLDEAFYLRSKTGDISLRLTKDVSEGIESLFWKFSQSIFCIVMVVSSCIVLFSLSKTLGYLYCAVIPFWMVYIHDFSRKTLVRDRELKNEFGQINARITEDITNHALIRVFAKEDQRYDIFSKSVLDYKARTLSLGRLLSLSNALTVTMMTFVLPLIMVFVAVFFVGDSMSAGKLMAVFGTWISASFPVIWTMNYIPEFISSYTSLERVFNFFDERPIVKEVSNASELMVTSGNVDICNVSFAYPLYENKLVLDTVSFSIKPRTRCAIVGASGSGKTTIANLLMRFYDPGSGSISIDGQKLTDVQLLSIRKQVGLVQQDILLWAGTVRDNLHFVNEKATEQQMWEALENAQLAPFFKRLPDQLETLLGERGVRLSGGQRQRLALARLFLVNPPIVILDEATSALDGLAERSVQKAMDSLLKNKTSIIIAHRLSTIQSCDKIVVLRDGKVIDQGNHKELLLSCDYYNKLCARQGIVV